jgi:hypothetical protein
LGWVLKPGAGDYGDLSVVIAKKQQILMLLQFKMILVQNNAVNIFCKKK